ncbi:hypothetical protein Pan54_45970 [Rubinisphaera italica]|uniref:Uncharacterized protein n=2 Tax=Rubinisphaera italica TaxID=2527969 RepID=A0A5C5XMA3_9PLAN|nr:hypothetical protein Pan54_45970 [Rubinisphaera italica]
MGGAYRDKSSTFGRKPNMKRLLVLAMLVAGFTLLPNPETAEARHCRYGYYGGYTSNYYGGYNYGAYRSYYAPAYAAPAAYYAPTAYYAPAAIYTPGYYTAGYYGYTYPNYWGGYYRAPGYYTGYRGFYYRW